MNFLSSWSTQSQFEQQNIVYVKRSRKTIIGGSGQLPPEDTGISRLKSVRYGRLQLKPTKAPPSNSTNRTAASIFHPLLNKNSLPP